MAQDPDMVEDQVLPGTGVVTFLFTDVVGSTAAWERDAAAMAAAMALHDRLIEELVAARGGTVVRPRGEGDSRFAVFADPARALEAAAALPRVLAGAAWPTAEPVSVRCAVHTGAAQLRAGDYYGAAVNRCARLRSIAHPGQVLASEVAVDLGVPRGNGPVEAVDLGIHWLKDLTQPERVFQLQLRDAVAPSFPPLRSGVPPLGQVAPLPLPASAMVGRDRDVAAVVEVLVDAGTRVVTVTGPGGVGKTRLAIEVAAAAADRFPGGASFVDLAAITDADAVLPAIAGALGVVDRGDGSLRSALVERLGQVPSLLVLDNLEQVVGCGPAIADLASVAPITVLATSRAPLRIRGEAEHRLDPLAAADAVDLFVERAQAQRRSYLPDHAERQVIAEICSVLDGLPLAVELAAARTRLLRPTQLLERLSAQLAVLVDGGRDAPDRQRTLRATIAWSYDLLTDDGRLLLRRLATFAGSFTLESAESVCGGEPLEGDLLDLLGTLVDSSLCRVLDDGAQLRFDLLRSIRAFAAEQPVEPDEQAELRRRHGCRMLELAEALGDALDGPSAPAALVELRDEEADLRAAAEHLVAADPLAAARLALALGAHWIAEGRLAEGRRTVGELLTRPELEPRQRVRLAVEAGMLAWYQDAPAEARSLLGAAVEEAEALGDGETAATARCFAAAATLALEGPEVASTAAAAALAAARAGGWYQPLAQSLSLSAMLAGVAGDVGAEEALHRERLALTRARGDVVRTADTLNTLAEIRLDVGDLDGARVCATESLGLALGAARVTVRDVRLTLARLALQEGDLAGAVDSMRPALELSVEFGQPFELALALRCTAAVAVVAGDRATAARLAGAADAVHDPDGDPFPPEADLEAALAAVMADPDLASAVAAGRALDRATAVAEAAALLDRAVAVA